MTDRFTDDIHVRQPGSAPAIVGELLKDLGVTNASPDVQAFAVARWLEDNEPLPLLRRTLESRGLPSRRTSSDAA